MFLIALFAVGKNISLALQAYDLPATLSAYFSNGYSDRGMFFKSLGSIFGETTSRSRLSAMIMIVVVPAAIFPLVRFIAKKIMKTTYALSVPKRLALWALESVSAGAILLAYMTNIDAIHNTTYRIGYASDTFAYMDFTLGSIYVIGQALLLLIPAMLAHKFFTKDIKSASQLETEASA